MLETRSDSDPTSSEDEALVEAALYRDLGIALPSRLARTLSEKKGSKVPEKSDEAGFGNSKKVSRSALPTAKARSRAPSQIAASQGVEPNEIDELESDTRSPIPLVPEKSEADKDHSLQPPLFRAGSDDDGCSPRGNRVPGSRDSEGPGKRDDFLEWLDDNVEVIQ